MGGCTCRFLRLKKSRPQIPSMRAARSEAALLLSAHWMGNRSGRPTRFAVRPSPPAEFLPVRNTEVNQEPPYGSHRLSIQSRTWCTLALATITPIQQANGVTRFLRWIATAAESYGRSKLRLTTLGTLPAWGRRSATARSIPVGILISELL